jgi:hypothetical protein
LLPQVTCPPGVAAGQPIMVSGPTGQQVILGYRIVQLGPMPALH